MEYNDLVEEILKRVLIYLQKNNNPLNNSTNNSISLQKMSKNIIKRVITERDIIDVQRENITQIIIETKTILTDLAKERAEKNGINITRR